MEQNTVKRRGIGLTGVDNTKTFGGYTLFAPLTSNMAYLVDIDGKEVHRWTLPSRVGRHVRLLPNGNLAANVVTERAQQVFPFFHKYGGGTMLQLDPNSNIVNQFNDPLGHHDQYHYGDGRILYTSLEPLSKEASAQVIGGVPGSEENGITYTDVIREVDASGNLTWEWRVATRLPRAEFPLQTRYTREHYPLINAVCPLRDGNVLASLRSVSAVVIISRTTGDIIWHLDSTVVAQQHCAHELPNGNILLFDNGAFRHHESVSFSRAIEVDRATKKIIWEYRDSTPHAFYTPFMGSVQRLANGNTLISDCSFGRIFEVTMQGTLCWEYVNPHFQEYPHEATRKFFPGENNAIFRAYRYSLEEIPWLEEKIAGASAAINAAAAAPKESKL